MARTYNSELRTQRAAHNRARVITTATTMFCENGWVATTMADVASAVELTRQTLYQQFPNKVALLDGCIDAALSEGLDVPVRELPAYQRMGSGTREERLRAAADWLCGAHQRSAVIQHVLDQAAVTDDDAAARLRKREQNRHDEVRWALGLVLGGPAEEHLVDEVWLLASRQQWLVLVGDRGWSHQEWIRWFMTHARAAIVRQ